jgi:hypothetical protein
MMMKLKVVGCLLKRELLPLFLLEALSIFDDCNIIEIYFSYRVIAMAAHL